MFKKCFLQDVRHNLREISFPDKRKDLFMNNKKLSIRVLFPLIMSISIVFCILSCMILFSHYISTYLVRKTIEETSRQKNVLAQNIENEIDSINSIMNNIYYNTIKKYDIQDKNFKTILANEITSNSETIYGLALYDTDGKNLLRQKIISKLFVTAQKNLFIPTT